MLTFAKNIINILGIVDDNIDKIDTTGPWGMNKHCTAYKKICKLKKTPHQSKNVGIRKKTVLFKL